MDAALQAVKDAYPWPVAVDVQPVEHGWFANYNRLMLARLLDAQTACVIELGSWLGVSTRWMCRQAPHAIILAVDHWQGSPEMAANPDWAVYLPTLYETFLASCWELKDRIVPVRENTVTGLNQLCRAGIKPDLIYVDGAHDTPSVYTDVHTSLQLFPEAIIVGDDWTFATVQAGVQQAVAEANAHGDRLEIVSHGCCWQLRQGD